MEVLLGTGTSLMVVRCKLGQGVAAFTEPEMPVECNLTVRTLLSHRLECTAVRCLMQTVLTGASISGSILRVEVLMLSWPTQSHCSRSLSLYSRLPYCGQPDLCCGVSDLLLLGWACHHCHLGEKWSPTEPQWHCLPTDTDCD